MRKVVVELTNRCNLSCQHCHSGRHGGGDDLTLDVLDRLLAEARPNGYDQIAFTGGDPTVHPAFAEVIARTARAGYRFGMVTNGVSFPRALPVIEAHRDRLGGITFSLDGATEAVHDGIRGKHSFKKVMQAATLCVIRRLPFTFNMVLTARNRHQIAEMADLAEGVGSRGLRFGELMPTPETGPRGLDLSPPERIEVEAEIRGLAQQRRFPIAIAPGYHTAKLFPCSPLNDEEINVDCFGNLTLCCHLSGHGVGAGSGDVAGNLRQASFAELIEQLRHIREELRSEKRERQAKGEMTSADQFPCWYCSQHFGKLDWLSERTQDRWHAALWPAAGRLVQIQRAEQGETAAM